MELRERQGQLSALQQYAREAREGRGRLVLVSGEAGVGKSALVEAFVEECAYARVLTGACDGQFTPRPLGPLLDIAVQAGGTLGRLVAEVAPRESLFAAARDELADGPLTIAVVEDVHWADEATLDLIRFLARRLRDARCLLLVTYRDQGLPFNDPLLISLGDLSSLPGTRRIAVPPLTRAAVAELAVDGPVSGDELYRLTRGNPFYVGEVLRGVPGEVPPSARDAVLARLAQLPPAGLRYAEAASLLGTRIDPALLVEVGGDDPSALDALVVTGLLVSDGTGLRFQHELARVAVEQETAAHRRQPLHQRILAALVERGVADDARLAYHAEGAADAAAVLRYAPEAARRAASLRSHREAALQLERALRFADDEPVTARARLYDALAREISLLDRWDIAAEHAQRALALWEEADDAEARSGTESFLCRVMWRLNRGQEGLALAQQAVRTVEGLGDTPALARATTDLAALLCEEVRNEEVLAVLDRAERLARSLDLPDVLSDALNTRACVLGMMEDPGWFEVMRTSIEMARDHGLHSQSGRGYANMHDLLAKAHRFPEAVSLYREGMAYCNDHDIATYGSCLLAGQAAVELDLGHWDDAESMSRQVLAKPYLSPANAIPPHKTLGQLLGRRGDPAALEHLDAAVGSATETGEAGWLGITLPERAEVHWLLGDSAAALADFQGAWPVVEKMNGWRRGLVAVWLRRLGQPVALDIDDLPEPARLSLQGDHEAAARAWESLLCPWEAALARYDAGTEESLREALAGFETLGADAAARLCRRGLRRLGVRSVPVGARATTREHPAGLTPRESEVLELLVEGLRNDEIAGRLVISVKTVDHHVSAVLAKLGVGSRSAAASEARRLGLDALPR
ncbi:AAA family ATPase [Marmoricola sp. URHB0036]|uniref:ATP-binding protein n=1 Tax=Marmoricola sp. URHB0036 TaxID=1298863 RepID=UPI0003F8198A|nr:AAA family ATPase [Marmoricola sp. URHB0036]